jgi:hypothetical protein
LVPSNKDNGESRPPAGPVTTLVPESPDSGEHTPIAPGRYLVPSSAWSVADFTITFPAGWTQQYGHLYAHSEQADESDEIGFYPVVVDKIFADACHSGQGLVEVGPGVGDLVAALRAQPGPEVSRAVKVTFGGYPATRIDLTVPKGLDLDRCREGGLQIWYRASVDEYLVLLADGTISVYILDIDGQRQVFVSQYHATNTAAERAELQAVVDSVRIQA